jgi:hypothetical protein
VSGNRTHTCRSYTRACQNYIYVWGNCTLCIIHQSRTYNNYTCVSKSHKYLWKSHSCVSKSNYAYVYRSYYLEITLRRVFWKFSVSTKIYFQTYTHGCEFHTHTCHFNKFASQFFLTRMRVVFSIRHEIYYCLNEQI